jgi:fermentation-respiration switch protein FrsA (DUF1100 family)
MKSVMNKIVSSLVGASFCLCFMSSCTSLLYFPSQDQYVVRERLQPVPDEIWLQGSDHRVLHAWYFHAPVRPKATILFFHGNAQNLTAHFQFLAWLPAAGYDYLIFDYAGYGMSDGKPSPKNTVEDGKLMLKWLSLHKAKGSEIVIFAQSLGAAVALRVAGEQAREPAQDASSAYCAVIIDSGFSSYRATGQRVLARTWLTWPFQYLPYLALSDEYAPEQPTSRGSKETWVSRISPHPILVVHGTEDQTIDYRLGEKVFAIAGEPKDFWPVPHGRHTDFLFRDNLSYRPRMLTWLKDRTTCLHGLN